MTNLEYYQNPKSLETETIIKNQTDMQLNQYATIAGIKGKQFGKEVFSSMVKFKDLDNFLRVFPEVQRSASTRKINKIKTYILSGVEDPSNMRFFSAITATARGHVFYDESKNQIAVDTINSKLSLNDGQHRFYGAKEAIYELMRRKNRTKDAKLAEKYEAMLEELNEMIMPIIIFSNISEVEEKQLFFDTNNLASRPSRSATIRLSQTDGFSRMARELSEENEYLLRYGVEMNKMSIHKSNLNTILLTTVYMFARTMFYNELRTNPQFLTEKNYKKSKNHVNSAMTKMFNELPQDLQVKDKYIVSKGYGLRGVAQFIYECLNDITVKEDQIYEAIGRVNWKEDFTYWSKYGAQMSGTGVIQFANHGESGVSAIKMACYDELNR